MKLFRQKHTGRQRKRGKNLPLASLVLCAACGVESQAPTPLPTPGSSLQQERPTVPEELSEREELSSLTLLRLSTAARVHRRRPVDVSDHFSLEQSHVWAYLEVENSGDEEEVILLWRFRGELRASHTLKIGHSKRWRTWSRIRLSAADKGSWEIELLDRAGRRLGNRRFAVVNEPTLPVNTPESSERLFQSPEALLNRPAEVTRLVLASAVRHRRPRGIAQRFPLNQEQIWGYVEAFNPNRDRRFVMSWRFKGEERFRIPVRVGQSRRWRTWTRILPSEVGAWSLVVLDETGAPVARRDFEVYRP